MKFLTPLILLVAFLAPVHSFGFGRALDQESANETTVVVARFGDTITLTAFSAATSKRWVILTPKEAKLVAVPRALLSSLEFNTRPVLQRFVERDPCEAASAVKEGIAKPEQKYFASADKTADLTEPVVRIQDVGKSIPFDFEGEQMNLSEDLRSYLEEGWVLREVYVEIAGDGVQFSYSAERFEIPPQPSSGKPDRGELTIISIAESRVEPVNFKSQLPPTNIEISREDVSDKQGVSRLLAAVFAEVDNNEEGAFLTEFALDLPRSDFGARLNAFSSEALPNRYTVARLRRLGDLGTFSSPIQLFPAFRMVGGDDVELNGRLRSGGYSSEKNDFRTRLFFRQPLDPSPRVSCQNPTWDTWSTETIDRPRANFDPTIDEHVRKRLFQKWLPLEVAEIYWSPKPADESGTLTDLKPSTIPSADPTRSQCSGCASAGSTSTLALLFAFVLMRRRAR